MKIAIYGAGAIGGLLAARFVRAEVGEISVIARGANLEALDARGITLVGPEEEHVNVPVRAVEDPALLGVQDYVIVAVKAPAGPEVAPRMKPLLGPATAVVTAQNGIPWWYFHRAGGAFEGHRLASVDPGGVQWRSIGPERVIGCVVYPAAELLEPGVVRLIEGDRFVLGEPSGERSARVLRLARAFVAAGFRAPVRPRIRDEIWIKLLGNLAFNPVSALTGATLGRIGTDPELRAVVRRMMEEAREVAQRLGVRFALDLERRIEGAAAVGDHRTSMLQDLERGRPLEIDALLGAVVELAELVSVEVPTLRVVLALLRARASS